MGSKSVQIVKFNETLVKATLNVEVFEEVIDSRPEIKDLPTAVVSIGGVTRSGKSFLLNLLVNYLTYLEKVGIVSLIVHSVNTKEIGYGDWVNGY